MLFNSATFLAFFSIVLFFYTSPLSTKLKKYFLLIASYVFYAAWNPPFVLLLWLSTLVDWFAAKNIKKANNQRSRKGWVAVSLFVNLGLLGFFKYGNFLLDNFVSILSFFHMQYRPAPLSIILPIGISFYTFQTISYTLDVYHDRRHCSKSFINFALYVTFFPQLVAGPIVRSKDFLLQCDTFNQVSLRRILIGIAWMILGLFEKVVIADFLMAPIADSVYALNHAVSGVDAWIGSMAFSIQIFCDFAGYSTCAIGAAYCLGFELPQNFNFPYAAKGFADFWRRWHISLSTWLRDYLYIPMGGSRKGRLKTFRNLFVTMFLGGLWHGAAWTFVLWGVLHGFYLILERILILLLEKKSFFKNMFWEIAAVLATYALICFSWMIFRSQGMEQVFIFSKAMLGQGSAELYLDRYQVCLVLFLSILILLIHAAFKIIEFKMFCRRIPGLLLGLCVIAMAFFIFIVPSDGKSFIYFQF